MGWGRTFLLGDIGNRLDIADAEEGIRALRRRVRSKARLDRAQDERIAELESESEQLSLYVATLTRLLVSKGVLTEAEVTGFVDIIDPEEKAPEG